MAAYPRRQTGWIRSGQGKGVAADGILRADNSIQAGYSAACPDARPSLPRLWGGLSFFGGNQMKPSCLFQAEFRMFRRHSGLSTAVCMGIFEVLGWYITENEDADFELFAEEALSILSDFDVVFRANVIKALADSRLVDCPQAGVAILNVQTLNRVIYGIKE